MWLGMVPGRQVAPSSSLTSTTPLVRSGPVLSRGPGAVFRPYATQCALVGQLRLWIAVPAGNGVTVKCLPPSPVAMNLIPGRTWS